MKAYICDQCKKQAEPDTYDLEPKGWIRLSARDEHKQLHYCGARCLHTAAEERCAREENLSAVQDISASSLAEEITRG